MGGEEFARGAVHEGFELVDEMRLIDIAETLREVSHLVGGSVGQGGENRIQTNGAGEGFWRDTRVIFELTLQLAGREIGVGGEIVEAEAPISGI